MLCTLICFTQQAADLVFVVHILGVKYLHISPNPDKQKYSIVGIGTVTLTTIQLCEKLSCLVIISVNFINPTEGKPEYTAMGNVWLFYTYRYSHTVWAICVFHCLYVAESFPLSESLEICLYFVYKRCNTASVCSCLILHGKNQRERISFSAHTFHIFKF